MIDELIGNYSQLKEVFENLADMGYTIHINHEGKTLAKVSKEADAWMMGMAGPVEISDMDALLEVIKKMDLL
ncbi:hypothetical protein ACFLQI_01060 [Candidatus Undinarchaeota archaeon]